MFTWRLLALNVRWVKWRPKKGKFQSWWHFTHPHFPLVKDLKAMCHYKTDFKPPSVLFFSTMKATKRRNVLWFRRRHERKFRIVLRHIVKDGNRALYFRAEKNGKKGKEKLFRESFWHLAIFCIHSLISLGNCS